MLNSSSEVVWTNLELKTAGGASLVHNASGRIASKSLKAIMGPSGSGKTSLLNCIAGRITKDLILSGEIKINGCDRDPTTWPQLVGYVNQVFHCHEWLTVYETLQFVALSRFGSASHVEELINLLGLSGSRNTLIEKLSGGERVRVSLGIELLGDAPIIILDEPLSGLDSFNALNVLELLRKVADLGKAILVTIHQPSYKMTEYFDEIILMCQGSTVFEGTLGECVKFFSACGFELPQSITPTDFFLDVLALDTRTEQSREASLRRICTIKREWMLLREQPEPLMTTKLKISDYERRNASVFGLFCRSIKNYYRNIPYLRIRVFQKTFTLLVLVWLFRNTGVLGANVFTFRGILAFIFQNELHGVSSAIMNIFIEEKKVIHRERASGLYSGYAAYFAKYFSELVINLAYAIPFNLIVYYFVGLRGGLGSVLQFMLIILSIIGYSISWGLTVGAIAPTTQVAQILGVTMNLVFTLCSGIFVDSRNLQKTHKWVLWISPVRYAFQALVHNQLDGLEASENPDHFTVNGEDTIKEFGMANFGVYSCLLMLLLFTLILQAVGAFVLHKKTKNNLRVIKKIKQDI